MSIILIPGHLCTVPGLPVRRGRREEGGKEWGSAGTMSILYSYALPPGKLSVGREFS